MMMKKLLAEGCAQEGRREGATSRDRKFLKAFQPAVLVFLLVLWIGYFCSICRGDGGTASGYELPIVALSLMSADAMFGDGEALAGPLRALARLEGAMLALLAFATVILTIAK